MRTNGYALTVRVVAVKVEADGDLHIALQDAAGDKPGIVIVEGPENRSGVQFATRFLVWTRTRFPFHTSSSKKLNVTNSPIITVVGKAFFDMGIL